MKRTLIQTKISLLIAPRAHVFRVLDNNINLKVCKNLFFKLHEIGYKTYTPFSSATFFAETLCLVQIFFKVCYAHYGVLTLKEQFSLNLETTS